MSTAAVWASLAANQAAMASGAAHDAKIAACKATVTNYDARTATVAEMRSYAECVTTLYPKEMGGGEIIVFKVLFVIALIGAGAAIWLDVRSRNYLDIGDTIISGVLGFIFAPIAVAVVAGLLVGVWWLLA